MHVACSNARNVDNAGERNQENKRNPSEGERVWFSLRFSLRFINHKTHTHDTYVYVHSLRTHARTHTHGHTRKHAHTHKRIHTYREIQPTQAHAHKHTLTPFLSDYAQEVRVVQVRVLT